MSDGVEGDDQLRYVRSLRGGTNVESIHEPPGAEKKDDRSINTDPSIESEQEEEQVLERAATNLFGSANFATAAATEKLAQDIIRQTFHR